MTFIEKQAMDLNVGDQILLPEPRGRNSEQPKAHTLHRVQQLFLGPNGDDLVITTFSCKETSVNPMVKSNTFLVLTEG